MELPKNITQIGEADRTCKVYVEDYVVSYMKQLCRRTEEKGLAIALYGKYTKEQSLSYFFIYGACQVLSISREVRHLSQAQNQEVERLRQHYFPEYEFLGYHIFSGDMVEGMHIREQDTCRYIKGYACFYEKNDSMLAYMVENKPQEHEPEQFGQEKYDRARAKQEERRSQYEHKYQQTNTASDSDKLKKRAEKGAQDPAQAASMKMMRMSAVAVFAVLCLVGVAAITREDGEGTLGERAQQLWAQLWDEPPKPGGPGQEGEAQEATAGIHDSGTLMAENSLADAILQENQQASEVSGQAVAGNPQEGEGGQTGAQPGASQEGGDGQSQTGASGQRETAGQTGASGQGETAGQTGASGQGETSGQTGISGQGETAGQTGINGQGETAGQTGTGSQGETSGGEETPGQGQESLNPDLQAPEVQPGGEPEQIPTQGPSIADIEAQQKPYSASYVIQPGDTLIGISTRQYGNDSYVQAICDLNGIVNPDNIQIGQKILLP